MLYSLLQKGDKNMSQRSCGECSACCFTHEIEALKKPTRTACQHMCNEGGCAIYDSKPEECTRFECAWLEGLAGEDSHRPDQNGLVVWSMHPSRWRRGFKTLNVMESADDAHATPAGQALLRSLLTDGWVLILRSINTQPMLQYHINREVSGVEYLIEELVDVGYMVNSVTMPLRESVAA